MTARGVYTKRCITMSEPMESRQRNPWRRRGTGLAIAVGAVLLLVALCGCESRNEESAPEMPPGPLTEAPPPATPITEIPISPLDESPLTGRWEVIDYELTPVAATDETTVMNWLGLLVIYSRDVVGFQAELCDAPTFREHREAFASYFEDFEVDPARFEITEPQVDVISIDCSGESWSGPGSEVIRVRGDSLVVVYDGVFLTMEPYTSLQR